MTRPSPNLPPLSYGQRALWFLQKLSPESAAYNVALTGRIRGAVDGEALRRGFQALADRHPALCTTYPLPPGGDGVPRQQVHERLEIDFAEIAAAWNEEELRREVTAEAHRPIDLQQPPVVRLLLFRPLLQNNSDDCVLLLVLHHIAVDILSLSVILTDLQELLDAAFAGRTAELPPPAGTYADFARWQAEMVQGPEGERSWDYWRNELAGELPQLGLPLDRPRPRVQSFRGGLLGFELDAATCAGLERLAEDGGTSLFAVVVAALQTLLHRASGQDEIVIGATLPGRPGPEMQDVVGFFVNTVLLRGDLAGDPPFRRLLGRAARTVSGAREHQHFPFPLLVERLAPERDLGRSPLYQVLLSFSEGDAGEQVRHLLTGEGERIRLGPVGLEPFPIDRRTSMLDLTVTVTALAGRLEVTLQYDADLFDPATAERLAGGLRAVLEEAARNPEARLSEIPLAGWPSRRQLAAAPPQEDDSEQEVEEEGLQGIAIIGLAVRFPGAPDAERFWENLRQGVESITFFDREELRAAGTDPALLDHPNFVRAAGKLHGVDQFDAGFFQYNAREASIIDPQQRVFLETAWEALEDAGCDPETFGGPIGVYAGVGASTYLFHLLARRQPGDPVDWLLDLVGNDKDFVATRTSYKLNLTGPSFTVQAACSTSLVATHLACQSLLNGECDVALAGGSSIATPQDRGYLYRPSGILSPDGHCRAFDARARGTVSGSGAGVVVLKRLEDALADGDRIRAVIRGSAVNNDGAHKAGFTAPSAEGQGRVISEALAVAGVPAQSLSYIETHGSGTPLGDTIEVAALHRVFSSVSGPRRCALGSVKTSLGHLDTAAGVAGLVKTVLALEHGELPASLHFEEPNPRLRLDEGPFYVNTELSPWPRHPETSGPRRAGVSAFGLGGTNAHLVLEEAPEAEETTGSRPWQLLLLSARTPTALEAATDRLSAHLAAHPEQDFADVAFTAKAGRRAFPHRRMLVCRDREDAAAALAGRDPARLLSGAEEMAGRPVAFVFPGLGEHYPGMTRGLYEQERGFRERIDRCAELLLPILGADLREVLYPKDSAEPSRNGLDLRAMLGRGGTAGDHRPDSPLDNRLDKTAFAQPALFAVEWALAGLWQDWGIKPQAVAGYSLGEYVAACVAGIFSLEDALTLVARRAQMIEELPEGAMLAVPLAAEALRGLLGPDLAIAAENGSQVSVIAGPPDAVAELEGRLAAQGLTGRRLRIRHAFHCGLMEPAAERLTRLVAGLERRAPSIPCLSNVTGTWLTAEEAADPGYWARHLLGTVRFADNVAALWSEPGRILLEVGPGQSLASLALQHPASDAPGASGPLALHSLPSAYERQEDQAVLLTALGRLWLAGVRVAWKRFYADERRRRAALPTYPFERQRYWVDGLDGPAPAVLQAAGAPPPKSTRLHARPNLANAYVEPETDLEQSIARLWQELLGVEQVGAHDSFFELGGHSLLATQVISHLIDSHGVELSLEQIFEAPTVAELAAVIAAADGFADGFSAGMAPRRPPILRRGDSGQASAQAPLSFAQQRLWFIGQLAPGSPLYNVPAALRVEGPLDVRVMELCLGEIVRRHETLRTVFGVREGGPVQVIRPPAPFALPLVDVAALPESRREALARTLIDEEVERPFDLARDPQIRATLLRLAEDDHAFVLTLHHVVCDSWSIAILIREFMALYAELSAGRPSPLPELPVQYADYAVWQRSWLQGATLDAEIAWWRWQLAGLPLLLALPTDRPRPAVQSFRGAARTVRWPAGLIRQAEALARREGATLFMVLLAGFQALLARSGGQTDLAVGAPIAGRSRSEVEGLIGFFINTLVLRGRLTGPAGELSFRELLRQARETALAAYEHQDVPFEKLVEELSPERRLDRNPLVQVSLILQNAPAEDLEIERLRLRLIESPATTSKFDLTFSLEERGGGLTGTVQYSTDLFDATTIDRLVLHYENLLAAAVAAPEEKALALPWLDAAERQQILVEWNDTRPAAPPGAWLPERFFAAAARWPEAEALRLGADALPYGELARRVRRRAEALRGRGVRSETVTALCLERSFEMVEAVLAVMAAGGAWVALDPLATSRVMAAQLEQARPGLLLLQKHLRGLVPERDGMDVLLVDGEEWDGGARLPAEAEPGALAYVSFTSGSTGAPKGILGTYGALANYLDYLEERWPLSPEDRVLQLARLTFDASCRDLLYPLTRGASVVLVPDDEARNPAVLLRELQAHEATCLLSAVPSLLRALMDAAPPGAAPAGEGSSSLRLVLSSGEPLSRSLVRRIRETAGAAVRIANQYGPSECTLTATVHPAGEESDGEIVPAGRPIPGLRVRVLDAGFREVPAGVAGQVFLGGAGVTRGYLGRPDLTAERFLPDPFSREPGERLYATGDLGFLRPDGVLDLLGRIDRQVKIRGIRIEPGEVEAALTAIEGVREAAVIADGADADRRLVAYVTGDLDAEALRTFRERLRERLPEALVPSAFVHLAALPLTPNGKLDRKGLPSPEPVSAGAINDDYVAPRSPLEEVLAGIWSEILQREQVGVHDDFFAIGGQSLLAAQLVAQVREIFQGELPLRTFFGAPTVAGLAAALLRDPDRRAQIERTAELMLEIVDAAEEEEVLAP